MGPRGLGEEVPGGKGRDSEMGTDLEERDPWVSGLYPQRGINYAASIYPCYPMYIQCKV